MKALFLYAKRRERASYEWVESGVAVVMLIENPFGTGGKMLCVYPCRLVSCFEW